MVVSPLHLLDCCLVTDGAGAFVMTRRPGPGDQAKPPVYVLGATGGTHQMISQMPDLTVTGGAVSGPAAFRMAGVKPDDVDLLMGYDSFTITALLHLEDLGFCAKGEGGAFVEDGKLGPGGGGLAMNTNGGGLSFTHPGMYGMFLLVEAVRQLRGATGERELAKHDLAVAHGSGRGRPWDDRAGNGRPRQTRLLAAGADRAERPAGRHSRAAPGAAVVGHREAMWYPRRSIAEPDAPSGARPWRVPSTPPASPPAGPGGTGRGPMWWR
jgi:hypothetical protein